MGVRHIDLYIAILSLLSLPVTRRTSWLAVKQSATPTTTGTICRQQARGVARLSGYHDSRLLDRGKHVRVYSGLDLSLNQASPLRASVILRRQALPLPLVRLAPRSTYRTRGATRPCVLTHMYLPYTATTPSTVPILSIYIL